MNELTRLRTISVFMIFVSIFLIIRLFDLHLWDHKKLTSLVKNQIERKKSCSHYRGIIYDRSLEILAMNSKAYSLAASPKHIENREKFAEEISKYIGLSSEEILKKLKTNSNFVWLKRFVPTESIKNSEIIENLKINGLIILSETKRYYPYKNLTAHIVGVTGIDNYGLSGVELLYDKFLEKKEYIEEYKCDGRSELIRLSFRDKPKIPNIVLTIDVNLQYIAYKGLLVAVEKYRPKKATVIIQNPNTGEILAWVCYPDFNPNEFNFDSKDLLNPGIHEVFEPGSTFKIVPAAAALSEGKFQVNDIIYCENGSYKYADIEINDYYKHGYLTFEGVMSYSSNIGFAKIGLQLGKEKLYMYSRLFGFGNYTGCELPGEQKGILYNPHSKKWSVTTTPTVAYGQGIAVTSLQLINAYSAIANGGILYEPKIIKALIDDKGNVLQKFEPQIVRRVISKEVAETLKDMLSKVVEYGTGTLAKVNGYRVCGKTGTAQKINPKTRKYFSDKFISSFCGFLPAENPQLTILIVLDEPANEYWASVVVCPIFKEIALRAINYLNIPNREYKYDFTKVAD